MVLRLYNKISKRPLNFLDGIVECSEVLPYSDKRTEEVTKFHLKGDEVQYVFEPPIQGLTGNVRIHFNPTFKGTFAIVKGIEFLEKKYKISMDDYVFREE